MFGKSYLRKILTFSITFLFSSLITNFLIENELPEQKNLQEKFILEKKVENVTRKRCYESGYSGELNEIVQERSELIRRKVDLHIRLENNKNASAIEKNNLQILIAGLKKQIDEYGKLESRLRQITKGLEKQRTAAQNLLYLQKCYEF